MLGLEKENSRPHAADTDISMNRSKERKREREKDTLIHIHMYIHTCILLYCVCTIGRWIVLGYFKASSSCYRYIDGQMNTYIYICVYIHTYTYLHSYLSTDILCVHNRFWNVLGHFEAASSCYRYIDDQLDRYIHIRLYIHTYLYIFIHSFILKYYLCATDHWNVLGYFEASSSRKRLEFTLKNPMMAKVIKIRLLSHHGNEFYW